MIISDIYRELKIPRNLQRHMLRVAAVGEYISKRFQPKNEINSQIIVTTLLFHDLGNLLKFNLGKGLMLLDEDERDLSHWESIKQEMIAKYGPDEHIATQRMAEKYTDNHRVLWLLSNMGSSNLHKTLKLDDWELKVVSYADFRVGPHGFLSVEERFADIIDRYKGRDHELSKIEKTLQKKMYCLQLEKQIQEKLSANVRELPKDDLESQLGALAKFEVHK